MQIPLDRLRLLVHAAVPLTIAMISMLSTLGDVRAQHDGERTEEAETPAPAKRGSGVKPLSLEFPGGTLAEFLQVVRVAGQGANIVASELANDIHLPSISLKNATVSSALMAVAQIVPGPFHADVREQRNGRSASVFAFQLHRVSSGPATTSAGPQHQPRRESSVYSLGSWVDPLMTSSSKPVIVLSPESILSAIDVGLSLTSSDDPATHAKIRYHEDTHLLFIRGTTEQIQLASQTINRLIDDLRSQRALADAKSGPSRPAQPSDPSKGPDTKRVR